MTPHIQARPRVGVPWRTAAEEKSGKRERFDDYVHAITKAGGEPVEVSLCLSDKELRRLADSLDGVVLPGSPADVEPSRYSISRHPKTAEPDLNRERTDDLLLDDAFASGKPVLAICYGMQLLNVHLGGTLFQDIGAELGTPIDHRHDEHGEDPFHAVRIENGRLARIAAQSEAMVNSSHHQAVRTPGRGLRIVATAPDGIVEAVEWTGDKQWLIGVQWHPERMQADGLAISLFRQLIAEALTIAGRRWK